MIIQVIIIIDYKILLKICSDLLHAVKTWVGTCNIHLASVDVDPSHHHTMYIHGCMKYLLVAHADNFPKTLGAKNFPTRRFPSSFYASSHSN